MHSWLIRPSCRALSSLFHLGFHRWLKSFTKETNQIELFWSSVSTKPTQDSLEVPEVRSPILNLLSMIPRVSFDSAPDAVHESPGFSEILLEKNLEIDPKQRGYSFALDSALVLVLTKADPTTKGRSCKGVYDWAQWRRRYQSGPHTVDKSGGTPYGTFHSRGCWS